MTRENLTPRPGIREQNLPVGDIALQCGKGSVAPTNENGHTSVRPRTATSYLLVFPSSVSGPSRPVFKVRSAGHLELLFDLGHERAGQAGLSEMAEVLKHDRFPGLSVAELLAAILQEDRSRLVDAAEKH
jgi:hypothetical protein